MRLFWGRVASKVNNFFVMCYLGLIGLCFKPLLKHNALESCNATSPAIGPVLSAFRQSEIAKAIVRFIPIDVINGFRRLLAGHVEPSQSMGSTMNSVDLKVNVPLVMTVTCNLPNLDSGSRLSPLKNTRFRVVIERIQEIFMVNVLHDQHHIVSYRDQKGLFYVR